MLREGGGCCMHGVKAFLGCLFCVVGFYALSYPRLVSMAVSEAVLEL